MLADKGHDLSPKTGWTAPMGTPVHPGETGLLYNEIGRIAMSRASLHGVDADLWERLRRAVDQLRLVIDLNAVDGARPSGADPQGRPGRRGLAAGHGG
jgi:hypothetical protein